MQWCIFLANSRTNLSLNKFVTLFLEIYVFERVSESKDRERGKRPIACNVSVIDKQKIRAKINGKHQEFIPSSLLVTDIQ